MPLAEVFPIELLTLEKKDEFLALLRELPIPPRRKKQMLILWCKLTGAVLTRDMVEHVIPEEIWP